MATSKSSPVETLRKALKKSEEGKFIPMPFDADDVGAELLLVLSKGLYTNPLDSVREYLQNSVDAGAKKVVIKLTGNSLFINDDGEGMDLDAMEKARKVGFSEKIMDENVGFRGIGIFSGFDLAESLVIQSKTRKEKNIYVLKFDFLKMKNEIEAARKSDPRVRIPLTELLSRHTFISYEEGAAREHFTYVTLQGLSALHVARLSDTNKMKAYILQNIPIGFSDDFEHGATITEELKEHDPSFKSIKVALEIGAQPRMMVEKNFDIPFYSPQFLEVRKEPMNPKSDLVAFGWACLRSDNRNKLPEEHSGMVFKVKGFTLGDRRKMRPLWIKEPLYQRHTGEVYVIDPAVTPNSERDDFESSIEYEMMIKGLRAEIKKVEDAADKLGAQQYAHDKLGEARTKLATLLAAPPSDRNEFYSELAKLAVEVKKRRAKATTEDKKFADDLRMKIKKAQAGISASMEHIAAEINEGKPQKPKRRAKLVGSEPSPSNAPSIQPFKRLVDIVNDAEVEINDDGMRVIEIIDQSMVGTLGDTSAMYGAITSDVEEILENEFGG